MITDERAEEALDYLLSTTGKIGDAKGELERAEILRKRLRKRAFMEATGTVAERDALAEGNDQVHEADDRYIAAVAAYESLRAKRDIEAIALDVWRTESAEPEAGVTKLRKQARGREYQIRVPGYCNRDPETVVGCHIRMAGITGFGLKANDLFISWGCYACHQIVDGQRNSEFTFEQRRLFLLEGVIRTQAILLSEGKIKT